MIKKLETVHYPHGSGNYTTEVIKNPAWDNVLAELRTMEPFEKPILTLHQHIDVYESDLMMINGGNDLFHIQVADSSGSWIQAWDPAGSDEIIGIWTSDQGFACERKFTWPLKIVTQIVKYYFEYAKRHPEFQWK